MKTVNLLIVIYLTPFCVLAFSEKHADKGIKRKREYMIQIQEKWIDTVKLESPRFGLVYVRQLVSNILLFEGNLSPNEGVTVDIKAFKGFFAGKIEHIEKEETGIVRYHSSGESKEKTFEKWILRHKRSSYKDQCWPYYGMGVQEAWTIGYTGIGINVAVVDIGIDVDHADLNSNIAKDLSYSFVDKNHSHVYPTRFRNFIETEEATSHGTMAAGLIAAVFGNNKCSSGVAFKSKIAALKVFHPGEDAVTWMRRGYALSIEHIPSAFAHKRDVIDIYSCSFNLAGRFRAASLYMKSALKEGVKKGRNGKGSIYVVSAGNRQGPIYDCNMEPLASSIYTVTISSIGINGSRPSYTIPCAATLASTYGEFKTLNGHRKLKTTTHDDKCDDFKGTSASTALASGIIALTLQANPNITWRDLQHIIVRSASHERFQKTEQLQKNAAGSQYDSFTGFGLMNAATMILMARNWTNVPPQKQKTVQQSQGQLRLLQQDVLLTNIQVGSCYVGEDCVNSLEHVQISLKFTKTQDGRLDIVLCSPHRTCSNLLSRNRLAHPVKNPRGWRHWIFTSVHFWGENPEGNWTVVFNISHKLMNKQFEVKNLALTLFGTSGNAEEPFHENTTKKDNENKEVLNSGDSGDKKSIEDVAEIVKNIYKENRILMIILIAVFLIVITIVIILMC